MRRHTMNEPSGPATSATPSPASTARTMKSSMARCRLGGLVVVMVLVVVRLIVAMGVDGEAVDRCTEERTIGGITAHGVGMAVAADMVVEADDAVGGRHPQMQIVRHQQHAAPARVAQPPDQG